MMDDVMRKFDKTKPHVQYIAMKKYKTMKTPVLCLKKVSLLRQQESDTDQDCARSRPWGWSARTHPPRYLSTSRISIITPSPLDISSRQCVLSCRPKIFMKRLKKAKCVRRLSLETATVLSLVVSVPLSSLVVMRDQQQHSSTVSTQTDPVFVGDYEEVRGLVREELSRTLRNLADELENTQQEVNKLQEEKKRLDALIHANSLLVHFLPSTFSRERNTSRGCGSSRGGGRSRECDSLRGGGRSRGHGSCARTRPRISPKQATRNTTPVANSTDFGICGDQSSASSDESIVYFNSSPQLDSSCEELHSTEQPLHVPCNTELPIETINSESGSFSQCLYELYSWLKVQSSSNNLSCCIARSIKEPLQLLSICLKHNAFDFSFPLEPIVSLLESAIELLKKSNSQLFHRQVVDLPPCGVNTQQLLSEVLQLLLQYDQENPPE